MLLGLPRFPQSLLRSQAALSSLLLAEVNSRRQLGRWICMSVAHVPLRSLRLWVRAMLFLYQAVHGRFAAASNALVAAKWIWDKHCSSSSIVGLLVAGNGSQEKTLPPHDSLPLWVRLQSKEIGPFGGSILPLCHAWVCIHAPFTQGKFVGPTSIGQ